MIRENKTKNYSVRIEPSLYRAILLHSKEQQIKPSKIIRELIKDKLK